MSTSGFEKLQKTRYRLMSLNSFLSTSKNKQNFLDFARSATKSEGMVRLLFIMIVNPNQHSVPFANIRNASYFKGDEEIIFSLHSVFRIDEVKIITSENRLFEVRLTLAKDGDSHLRIFWSNDFVTKLTVQPDWVVLEDCFIQVEDLDKAEELYQSLLEQPSTTNDVGLSYNQLGTIKKRHCWWLEESLPNTGCLLNAKNWRFKEQRSSSSE